MFSWLQISKQPVKCNIIMNNCMHSDFLEDFKFGKCH